MQSALDGKANLSGATFTGKVLTAASITGTAGLTIPHGVAPTSPVNGDIWSTTTGLVFRVDGATKSVAFTDSNITGSAASLTTARDFSISGGGITATAQSFNGTANVTLSASVDSGHITLARMANLAANSIIGNNTGGAITPIALTATQVTAMLNEATVSLKGLMSSTDKTKLDGIATGATANQTDSYLLARSNHTGTQSASTISDLSTTVQAYRLDQFAAPTSSVAFNNQRITGLAAPTGSGHAATYEWTISQIQSASTGISVKDPVRVVSTTNITRSGTPTIDGITTIVGNRVLLVGQTDGTQNGVYVVAAGAWSRSTSEDETSELKGAFWLVEEGTVHKGTQWIVNNEVAPVMGTDVITIVQFGAVTSYTASLGIQLVGSDFRAQVVAGGGIQAVSGGLQVDTGVVARKFSGTIGDGSSTALAVTHNLGTKDVQVSIRDAATDAAVWADWVATTTNAITINFAVAPSASAYRVTIIG
jgi:hypothetical protein